MKATSTAGELVWGGPGGYLNPLTNGTLTPTAYVHSVESADFTISVVVTLIDHDPCSTGAALELAGQVAGVVADPGIGDWAAVYTQNGNQSKVDVFQQRNVVVNVRLADDGSATVRQDVVLTNATPPDRPVGPAERIGYETMWARNAYLMYIPVQARNFTARYPPDFVVRPFRNHVQYGLGFTDDGYGQKLVRVVGWTPPGGQSTVSVSYELPPGTFLPSAGSPTIAPARLVYTLVAEPQSIWNPSTLTVRVTAPPGWNPVEQEGALVTGNTIEVSAVQEGPVRIRLPFQRGVL
jgi:hypothetical protein